MAAVLSKRASAMSTVPSDLRQSDLDDSDSRYLWIQARPNQALLHTVWTTWSAVSFVAALAAGLVILGLLHSPSARRNTFNLYVMALCFPDLVFNTLCSTTCALSAGFGKYFGGATGCAWQSFYVVFGFSGSMWMLAVVATEIRRVLWCAHELRNYKQPTPRQVMCRVCAVYGFSVILACLPSVAALSYHALPLGINLASGMACVPMAHDLNSEMVLWMFYLNVCGFIPLGLVLATAVDVYRRGYHLEVYKDPHRELVGFFAAVLAVYLIMWLPSMITIWVTDARFPGGNYVTFFGGMWSHVQGLVSATIYLRKPDVGRAVAELPGVRRLCRLYRRRCGRRSMIVDRPPTPPTDAWPEERRPV